MLSMTTSSIATETKEEQEKVIIQALQTIQEANLTLNPNKCLFNKREIPFWGMIVSGEGVRPDPNKVQALRECTHPENKSEVMSFLCMLQANSEFIPGLSKETENLRRLTQKTVRFRWTDKCQQEFERLRELLCENALLNYFDTNLPTFVIVDAHRSSLPKGKHFSQPKWCPVQAGPQHRWNGDTTSWTLKPCPLTLVLGVSASTWWEVQ